MKKNGSIRTSVGPFDSNLSTAETLQRQYLSVFTKKDNVSYTEEFFHGDNDCISDIDLTVDDIEEKINSLKNGSPGADSLTPQLLKKCAKALSPVLLQLFKQIMSTGLMPRIFKYSLVIPLLKGGIPPHCRRVTGQFL